MVSKRMDGMAKILLGGVAAAALVVGVGYAALIKANLHVSDLVAQCKTKENVPTTPYGTPVNKAEDFSSYGTPVNKAEDFSSFINPADGVKRDFSKFVLICDPEILRAGSRPSDSVGIQAKIIDTQRQGERWFEQATIIAIGVLILSATPYVWYFLLRRVRELRDALVGK